MKVSHRWFLAALLLVGTLSLGAVFLSYYSHFPGAFINSHEKWGQFGDFVGGTANPILAFFTFVGVLWTISLTYDLRKDQQTEAKKSELHKVIDLLHNEIDTLLDKPINIPKGLDISGHENKASFREMSKYDLPNVFLNGMDAENPDHFNRLWHLFVMLRTYLTMYQCMAGDKNLSDYYRISYFRAVKRIEKMDNAMMDTATVSFFEEKRDLDFGFTAQDKALK